jgi:putative metallohydrolase (TIGR04338 family)
MDFFGSMLTIPVQRRFGDLSAVKDYVEWVCNAAHIPAPRVRTRKGHRRAHYEGLSMTIALPGMDGSLSGTWAARESVVLHELAHHRVFIISASLTHDADFRAAMVDLATIALGYEAALLLRAGYDGAVRG